MRRSREPTQHKPPDVVRWVNLSALFGTLRVYAVPGDVDFVDNGASPDTIVRQDGGSWVTDGFVVGRYVATRNTDDAGNVFSVPIVDVTASTITVATGTVTADTGDATAEFTQVAYDPNGVMAGCTWDSDPAGTTVEVQNATSVDGFAEGSVLADAGAWSSIFPGFDAATHNLLIEGTVVTAAPNSKVYWQGIVVTDDADISTANGVGVIYTRTTTTDQATAIIATSNSAATTAAVPLKAVVAFPANGGRARILVEGSNSDVSQFDGGDFVTACRAMFSAGCESALDDGPHSAKVLWKAAVVRRTSI